MNGQQFKARREQLGLNREQACALLGFNMRTLAGWEQVEARGTPPEWVERLTAFWLCDREAFEAFKAFHGARKKLRAE